MTRPSLDRSEEQRHRERDSKEWAHHNFAPLILHFHEPVRDAQYLQGLIEKHLPFAIVSLHLIDKEVLIIDAEYLTTVHFFYIPLDKNYKTRSLYRLYCDFPLKPKFKSLS